MKGYLMKRIVFALAVFAASMATAAAQDLLPGPPFASEAVAPKDTGKVMPVAKMPAKPMKIAVLSLGDNFWLTVKVGIDRARELLAEKNCQVDWIVPGEKHTTDVFGQAIESCIVQQYDAIAVVAGDSGMVPYINRAVEAGIPVATFNSETDEENKRFFYVGGDSYLMGQTAADYIIEATGGKGKIGILTGFFAVEAHELRRKGFEDRIAAKAPGMEIVNRVETMDKNELGHSLTQDIITAHPDLAALYVIAAGQFGACRAIDEAGLGGKVTVVAYDMHEDMIEYIESGTLSCAIGQDPVAQGRDPAIRLYNYLVGGVVPPAGKLICPMPFITKENAHKHWPPQIDED